MLRYESFIVNLLSRFDQKFGSISSMVYSSNSPCNSNTQENIDGITSRYVANASISIFILYRGHFASKRI